MKEKNIRKQIIALKDLTDQTAIAQYINKEFNVVLREVAIEKLDKEKWQDLFADLAKNDKDSIIRGKAIAKLKPELWQDLLSEIAVCDEDEYNRLQAIEYIKNEEILQDIVEKDFSVNVKIEALKKINNQEFLMRIAVNSENPVLREIANNKLDPEHKQTIEAEKEKSEKESGDKESTGMLKGPLGCISTFIGVTIWGGSSALFNAMGLGGWSILIGLIIALIFIPFIDMVLRLIFGKK